MAVAHAGRDLSGAEARRLALAAQGFDRPRPARVGARELSRTIRELGLVQLDYVNVVVPSHYQVMFARLGPFSRPRFDQVVYGGDAFTEQWAHEASAIPVELWPLLRHRMEERALRPYRFATLLFHQPGYADWVLEEIRARGPLAADQLAAPPGVARRIAGSWYRSVPRMVLEAHFARGRLAVVERRPSQARVFDLIERRLPVAQLARRVDAHEAQRELLAQAARRHGVGTAGDLADYYRMPIGAARPRLRELVEAGTLAQVRVEGWREPAFLDPAAKLPRTIAAAALLSPFDPVVWFRARIARLFDFEYRFEIFVPDAQRRWGSYVLPFLLGDRLVARVDLKALRDAGQLRVNAAYLEPGADAGVVAEALAAELTTMAAWLGLDDGVTVGRRGNLARRLATAVTIHR